MDRRQAQTWRDGEKLYTDTGPIPTWQPTAIPGHYLLKATVRYGDRDMRVEGEVRGPATTQIRLLPPEGPGNLARLCLCPRHGDDVHWHWYEDMDDGIAEARESVPTLGEAASRDAMLKHFTERLKIRELTWQEELTDD